MTDIKNNIKNHSSKIIENLLKEKKSCNCRDKKEYPIKEATVDTST